MDPAMQCYLKGREMHLMFTPKANERARALFQEAIDLDGTFHRAKGHLAYANIQAWLYGWSAIDLTTEVRDRAWDALYSTKYPAKTNHDGADDYDNWWSVGVALLYYAAHEAGPEQRDATFAESIDHYEQARVTAKQPPVAIDEDMADLLADCAEALYFRGDKGDVQTALALLDDAKGLSGAGYPKWHDWNCAWVYYELGGELASGKPDEFEAAYLTAIDLLTSVPNLPNLHRRSLAACYAALGWNEEARRVGRQYLRHERARGRPYDPEFEMRFPYKDPARSAILEKKAQNVRASGPYMTTGLDVGQAT